MRCMRCGIEIPEQQVFCKTCLAKMEKDPIKPGTTVQLPNREVLPPVKKKFRRHWDAKPEEQLKHQKLVIRCLCAALAVSVAAFVLAAGLLLKLLDERTTPDIGQNYGSLTESKAN